MCRKRKISLSIYLMLIVIVNIFNIQSYKNSSIIKQELVQRFAAPVGDYDWSTTENRKKYKINEIGKASYKQLGTFITSKATGAKYPGSGANGFCITDKYFVFSIGNGTYVEGTSEYVKGYIYFLDKNNCNYIGRIELDHPGHMNDITYNSKTKEIVVLGKVNKDGKQDRIIIDADKRIKKRVEQKKMATGIGYNKKENGYACSCGEAFFFEDLGYKSFNININEDPIMINQGLGTDGKYIYRVNWEVGNNSMGNIVWNSKQKSSNMIAVYDYNGKFQQSILIPNTVKSGEMESLDFDSNGDMIAMYQNWDSRGDVITFAKITYKHQNAINPTLKSYTGIYDGKPHTIEVSGGKGGTIQYSTDNKTWTTTKPTRTNAGTTKVYVRVEGDSSHYNTNSITADITVNKKHSTNPTLKSYTGIYDGKPHTIEVINGNGGTIQYSTDNKTWTTTKPIRTNVGTTTVYLRIIGDANHNNSETISANITINKKHSTNPILKEYVGPVDGKSHTIEVISGNGGTIQYSTDNKTWTTTKPSRINEGTTIVYVRIIGDTNHNDSPIISSRIELKSVKGDITKDGYINSTDAAFVLDIFKYQNANVESYRYGDMNDDHILNSTDASIILDIFKNS